MHLKEKHDTDVIIRKKDVLESGTEYEITVVNTDEKNQGTDVEPIETLPTQSETTSHFFENILQPVDDQSQKLDLVDEPCDESTTNHQLLNELNVNDLDTLVKNSLLVLSDSDLRPCSSGGHHQHFDEFKLMDFTVM